MLLQRHDPADRHRFQDIANLAADFARDRRRRGSRTDRELRGIMAGLEYAEVHGVGRRFTDLHVIRIAGHTHHFANLVAEGDAPAQRAGIAEIAAGHAQVDDCLVRGIDQAEDRSVGRDAQGERDDGHRGESGSAAHDAQAVADVLEQALERAPAPHLARNLADQVTLPNSEGWRPSLAAIARWDAISSSKSRSRRLRQSM